MAEASIQTKYERLAQEYAKLRSNTTVLKKAVIEEKTSKTKLSEDLKSAEMMQRKTKQELEALQFRNQQLSKRIVVLQDDLAAAQAVTNKKRGQAVGKARGAGPGGAADIEMPDQELIIEQLQKTIEENAKLNTEISEVRLSFEAQLRQLRDSNDNSVENSRRELQEAVEQQTKIRSECSLLLEEKRVLENQLIAKEAVNQQMSLSIDDLQKKLAALQQRYDQFKMSVANSRTAGSGSPSGQDSPSPQISSPASESSTSSYPTGPPPTPQALVPCLQTSLGFSLRFIRGMKEWHENHAKRLKQPFGPLRSTPQMMEMMRKCSEEVSGLETAALSIEAAMKESVPKLSSEQLAGLISASKRYGNALIDSISPLCQRIEDECALSFCPASLAERNKEIMTALSSLSSTLAQILPAATQSASLPNGEQQPPLQWCCEQLLQACKQLARLLNRKVSLEQTLPDLSDEVKAANEAMVHGLLVARTGLEKLQAHLSSHASFFSPSGWAVAREILLGPDLVQPSPAPSACTGAPNGRVGSPQLVLSSSQASLASPEEVRRLQREVALLQDQVRGLEQDRDRLGLEAQLERMRRGKESQKRSEVEKELLSIRSSSPSSLPEDASSLSGGGGGGGGGNLEPTGTSERELVIQRYYQEIVSKQQQDLYLLTGVAENFKTESENSRAQWMLMEKRNAHLESVVSNLQLSSKTITEDLESTRRNYETQLGTLTEHIADMNEKLVQRQDYIEALKRQVETKNTAKRK